MHQRRRERWTVRLCPLLRRLPRDPLLPSRWCCPEVPHASRGSAEALQSEARSDVTRIGNFPRPEVWSWRDRRSPAVISDHHRLPPRALLPPPQEQLQHPQGIPERPRSAATPQTTQLQELPAALHRSPPGDSSVRARRRQHLLREILLLRGSKRMTRLEETVERKRRRHWRRPQDWSSRGAGNHSYHHHHHHDR